MRLFTIDDVKPLAVGSALLGSGGGGDPTYAALMLKHQLITQGPISLISVDELTPQDLVMLLGIIGAPLVNAERLITSRELQALITTLEQRLHKKATVLMPGEIGGANAFAPLLIAAQNQMPVLDADLIGRAFPELPMNTGHLRGYPATPAIIADGRGNTAIIEAIDTPMLEHIARHLAISMGSSAAIALHLMAGPDIGGTSTDVGLVRKGFPLRSINTSNIGGISLNFPMPDLLSIAIGGGSLIDEQAGKIAIGSQSVAKTLQTEALSFGGNRLTLTDVALAHNHLQISGARPIDISSEISQAVFQTVLFHIDQLIAKMRGEHQDLPVVYVGGGVALLPPASYCIPRYFDVANAYGAALAEMAGSIDTSVSLQHREETLQTLHARARQSAIDQGADPQNVRLIDQQIIPYAYMPNQMARVILRYAGKRGPHIQF